MEITAGPVLQVCGRAREGPQVWSGSNPGATLEVVSLLDLAEMPLGATKVISMS